MTLVPATADTSDELRAGSSVMSRRRLDVVLVGKEEAVRL
jgi:hypothetical protein